MAFYAQPTSRNQYKDRPKRRLYEDYARQSKTLMELTKANNKGYTIIFVVYLPKGSGFAVHNGSVEVFESKYGESIKVH